MNFPTKLGCFLIIFFSYLTNLTHLRADDQDGKPLCRIEVVDRETGWPISLVELITTHNVQFVTDNAGIVAFDLPELMDQETWFTINGNGYGVPADGFGYRGVRLKPSPGETLRVELDREIIAKRLGRHTGAGLFAESQRFGDHLDWKESRIVGCDSVQNAVHRGKHFWLWGDTSLAWHPLGLFHSTSATTDLKPLSSFEPPLKLKLNYFVDEKEQPRNVAKMPGSGPTWLTGYISLPDTEGTHHLVATYSKINPPLESYEVGLCVWNDETSNFEQHLVVWSKSEDDPEPPPLPKGHPVLWEDESGKEWVLIGDPLPKLRFPATFEAWQDADTWEVLEPQESLEVAGNSETIRPHSGSIAWNEYRKRWVTVFMQFLGEPSAFGELWYAEADEPTGPWGPAVKVLTHENYTFYNPRIHPEFTPEDSPILLFEGTYTALFADRPEKTPRYDYNQIMYRLDLDDPALAPARGE